MSGDGSDSGEVVVEAAPSVSAGARSTALVEYLARMRRLRRIYVALLAVLIIAVAVLVQVVLRAGEISHASLHQATSTVPAPAETTTSSPLTQVWRSDDTAAKDLPVDGGTVITFDKHTVSGRNYATGASVWTYTRTDLIVCTVYQQAGLTFAIYTDRDGFCDEIDVFKTATGARAWYRTLDSNGNTITATNPPTFSISPNILMVTTPLYIQAVVPSSGIDRWTFIDPPGCTNASAVQGSDGILIAEHCTDGDYLVLRNPYDLDDKDNKAKARWRIRSHAIPVSADQLISALDQETGDLDVYDPTSGKLSGAYALRPAPTVSGTPAITADSSDSGELVTVAANTYLLDSTSGRQLWTAAVSRLTYQTDDPLTITDHDVTKLDGTTGIVANTYPLPNPAPTGATATQLGTGFIIAGPSSTTVYR